jgi:hypothetical protein
MGSPLVNPRQLHEQALKQAFSLDAIPFDQGVSATSAWAPRAFVPHAYLPSYELLDEGDRAVCAQFAGLAIAELFIYLEEAILVPAVEQVLASRGSALGADLRHCLLDLIEEEHKHTEMFWRLLERARPDWYPTRQLRFQRGGKRLATRLMTRHPDTFIAWVWVALLFEELTIHVYRHYRDDATVDPLFREVHRFHMLDEARHFRIEQHLLKAFWDPAPFALRAVNARLFGLIMARFVSPRLPLRALELVFERSPHLRAHEARFRQDIFALAHNDAYQQAYYSRDALPLTFQTFDAYPEMDLLAKILPAYTPRANTSTRAFNPETEGV